MKHTENETEPTSAAQTRVTPEELAAAITRLEARKDAGRRQAEGTVAIGEVVQQLGLDATPEEVLAEVRRGRDRQPGTINWRRPLRRRTALAISLGALSLGVYFWVGARQTTIPSQDVPASLEATVQLPPPLVTSLEARVDPNVIVRDSSGKLVELSEVGDDQPVKCVFGSPNSFQAYQTNVGMLCTLIKHNGDVYVRGWTMRMSPKAIRANGMDVSLLKSSNSIPITLSFGHFRITAPGLSLTEFHAQDVRLDGHAYEKWQP